MLMWAYPQEYKSADAAGQVTDSPYRFIRIGWWSPLLWLVHGYAVLDDPTMPIVGEGDEEPNDTYIEQLVSSARAAVDEVVKRGVANRNRIAIGGHSYGAFMAANLLAHSDLYRAGIARSGAYNRTLTPFGFQSEERTLWETPGVYFAMSPFMHAEKVNEPILLIHGEADNNSGTYPLQSERFYGALKGQGATARLVMLPHESHGYRARESVMHVLWEMTEWLDNYVKYAPPREETEAETGSD
jgi:dipeptidyl aminopeptidase/acylaminoacyl peptidase